MATQIKAFEQLDAILLKLAGFETVIAKQEAAMNAKIQKIRDDFDQTTSEARKEKIILEQDIEIFCKSNKSEFEKTRSKDFVHGTLGFRFNTPKVGLLNRKATLKTAMELIKRIFEGKYVRNKEEINKELILADYAEKKIDDEKLAAVGLKIDQDETFYIAIKWDQIEQKDAA